MRDTGKLMPLMDYDWIWLVLGIVAVVIVAGTVFTIFWATRRKPVKKISTLPMLQPHEVDVEALRVKYLAMVDEVARDFGERKVKSSEAHQKLSLIARFFVFEASGFRAQILTLADLKKAKRENLTSLIEVYYPPEFDGLEKGSVSAAADLARKLIGEWR